MENDGINLLPYFRFFVKHETVTIFTKYQIFRQIIILKLHDTIYNSMKYIFHKQYPIQFFTFGNIHKFRYTGVQMNNRCSK